MSVLQQLRTATPDNPLFALSLATHPPAQTRIEQLELAMGKNLDGFTGAAPVTLAQRMQPKSAPAASATPAYSTPTPPARKTAPARKKSS